MAQSKQQIQSTLAAAGMQPRHRFGQNFMIDQNLVRTIADAAMIEPGDTVIEVGPGTGTLTEELLARAGQVMNNATFRPFLVFSIVAAIYFALCWPLSWASRRLERRLGAAHAREPGAPATEPKLQPI